MSYRECQLNGGVGVLRCDCVTKQYRDVARFQAKQISWRSGLVSVCEAGGKIFIENTRLAAVKFPWWNVIEVWWYSSRALDVINLEHFDKAVYLVFGELTVGNGTLTRKNKWWDPFFELSSTIITYTFPLINQLFLVFIIETWCLEVRSDVGCRRTPYVMIAY